MPTIMTLFENIILAALAESVGEWRGVGVVLRGLSGTIRYFSLGMPKRPSQRAAGKALDFCKPRDARTEAVKASVELLECQRCRRWINDCIQAQKYPPGYSVGHCALDRK